MVQRCRRRRFTFCHGQNHGGKIRLSRRCTCNQNRSCQEYGVHKRELDVLRELVNGRSQKDTADILGIKYDSVRTHLKSILVKTGYDTPSRFIAEVSHKNYMIPEFYETSREDEDIEK